jgi:DDE superfamily endonuclease
MVSFILQSVTTKQLTAGRARLEMFLTEMLAPLGRKDRRQWGGVYLRGLLLDGDRKSAGAMASRLPDGNEQSLQQFLNQSPWDWLPLWRQMAARVERTFPSALAWIIDDTGFPKKGRALGRGDAPEPRARWARRPTAKLPSVCTGRTRAAVRHWASVCICQKSGPMTKRAAKPPVCPTRWAFSRTGN